MKRLLLAIALLAPLGACENAGIPWPDLERMKDQQKHRPHKASAFFEDGRSMRTPPEGTVPRERELAFPEFTTGLSGNEYVEDYPIDFGADKEKKFLELLERGRDRFDIYCAVCHGVLGDGESRISARMSLRKAPTLHSERIKGFPPGRIYYTISKGFGLMPSYAHELDPKDRWAVVAYVKALQLSQSVSPDALSGDLRNEAQKAVSQP